MSPVRIWHEAFKMTKEKKLTELQRYVSIIDHLSRLKCLTEKKQKVSPLQFYEKRYFIRGTRYYFDIWLYIKINIRWSICPIKGTGGRHKNTTFNQVLLKKAISESAKEELIFNMDIFR